MCSVFVILTGKISFNKKNPQKTTIDLRLDREGGGDCVNLYFNSMFIKVMEIFLDPKT